MISMRCSWLWLGAIGAAVAMAAARAPAAGAAEPPETRWEKTLCGQNAGSELVVRSADLPVQTQVPWSVQKKTLHGGRQEGVELIVVQSGRLEITLIPTRGLSLLEVRVVGTDFRLGWNSPVKEVVHPALINLDSRGGLGWLEGFNEWMVRCGLEFAGHPGTDKFIDNTGATAEMNLTLHGKIGNIPASQVSLEVDRRPPHALHIRGLVYERMFFGPKLELQTELTVVPGATTFDLTDQITNQGGLPQEFQLIYHVNYGKPLLEAGAQLLMPAKEVIPMNDQAVQGLEQYTRYQGPTPGFIEQVYLMYPKHDDRDRTTVLLQNARGDRGASITWNTRELPHFTVWKNTAAEADGYVTGLEPGTGFPHNRRHERQGGRVPQLAPGQSRQFTLQFGVHTTAEEVQRLAARVRQIQGSNPPELRNEPLKFPDE